MKPHPTHYWPTPEQDVWILSRPSRRLRKLYRALAAVETRMDAVRHLPASDHAPSDYVYYCQAMKPLRIERDRLTAQIALLQNQEEGWAIDRRPRERVRGTSA